MTATAKIKKKATKRHKRLSQAHTKVVLASVASIILGIMEETEVYIQIDKQKEIDQIQRVKSWANKCFTGLTLGSASISAGKKKITTLGEMVDKQLPDHSQRGLEEYAAIWIMISFLCEETNFTLAPKNNKRTWNFLTSTVTTWTQMLMNNADNNFDFEGLGGKFADKAWPIIFDRPRSSFAKL